MWKNGTCSFIWHPCQYCNFLSATEDPNPKKSPAPSVLYCSHPYKHPDRVNYWKHASKWPHGSFGMVPARAPAFISNAISINADITAGVVPKARKGFLGASLNDIAAPVWLQGLFGPFGMMPAGASVFSYIVVLMNADAFAGTVPEGPQGHLEACFQ